MNKRLKKAGSILYAFVLLVLWCPCLIALDYETSPPGELYQDFLDNELSHADIPELVLIARNLGLAEQGDREALIKAIKAYYDTLIQQQQKSGNPDTADKGPQSSNENQGAVPPVGNEQTSQADGKKDELEITIESAAGARYFTIEETDSHIFRLLGGVSLKVIEKKNGNTHVIKADEILFDKDNQEMVARKNVAYSLDQGGEVQNFTGDEMRFFPETGDATFLNGKGNKNQTVGGIQQVFHIRADLIIRILRDILIFSRSELSSSVWTPDAYQIGASRIWVLSPGEWAMNDLVLYLGHIPVFYMPFFYVPSDELIFHPAVGDRNIEGSYVQTTWYLVGRKKNNNDGISFLQLDSGLGDNYRLVPHGLFLQKVSEKKAQDQTAKDTVNISLATIYLDYYSRLGYLGAFNMDFSGSVINKAALEIKMAATKRIYSGIKGYTNYYEEDSPAVWDASHLLGSDLPFRYAFDFTGEFKINDWKSNVTLSLPSDPYIESLYDNRAEDIDWSGLVGFSEDTSTTSTSLGTATGVTPVTVTNSFAINTTALDPWIKAFGINKLDLRWPWTVGNWTATVTDDDDTALPQSLADATVAAEKKFFYPSLMTLPDLSMNMSGTLFQYPFPKTNPAKKTTEVQQKGQSAPPTISSELIDDPLVFPGDEPAQVETAQAEPVVSPEVSTDDAANAMPVMENTPISLSVDRIAGEVFRASLTYSFTPSGNLQSRFKDSTTINDPYDIDAVPLFWMGNYGLNGSLNYSLGFLYDMVTATGGASVSRMDRELFGESDELDAADSKYLATYNSALDSAAAYDATSITQTNTVTLSPFKLIPFLSQTSFQYQLSELLYQHKYASKNASDSTYEYTDVFFDWNSIMVTTHTASATIQAQEDWFRFTAGVTCSLPPEDESVKYNSGLTLDFLTFGFSGNSVLETVSDAKVWAHDPMNFSITARLMQNMNLTSSLAYNIEDDKFDAWKTTFKYDVFSMWATFKQDARENYVIGAGWQESASGQEFQITELGSTLNLKVQPDDVWEGRIRQDIALNFSIKQSLIRATDSLFAYDFSYSFKLHEFIDLTFAIKGENAKIYRYFPGLIGTIMTADGTPVLNTIDFFEDIANSLDIFDEDALKKGNFKLKSLSLKLTHELGDWNFSFQISAAPQITATTTSGVTSYTSSFNTSCTFLLQWKAIEEIKQNMKYEKTGNVETFKQVKS